MLLRIGSVVFVRRSTLRPARAHGQGTVTAITPTHVHVDVRGVDLLCVPQEVSELYPTWQEVLNDANEGKRLLYHAPMDLAAYHIDPIRVYKNGKIRFFQFTADPDHLGRFRRSVVIA